MFEVKQFRGKRWTALVLAAVAVLWQGMAQAAEPAAGEKALLATYESIKPRLEKNQFGAPIYLESTDAEHAIRVDVYGIFPYPFDTVKGALQSPGNWCDIAPLHINIKACTWRRSGNSQLLTLYSGHKQYQSPADAYKVDFIFQVLARQPRFLDLALSADHGPLRTKDHRIRLQLAPLDGGRTLLHFSYSYSHGQLAQMAINTYFSTIARDKVGFSVIANKGGHPEFVGGVRGALERNAFRYYLALETYIDTLNYPENRRFEQRLNRWYDLTARYPRQLKENEKAEYLLGKRREHDNQLVQQKKDGKPAGGEPVETSDVTSRRHTDRRTTWSPDIG